MGDNVTQSWSQSWLLMIPFLAGKVMVFGGQVTLFFEDSELVFFLKESF